MKKEDSKKKKFKVKYKRGMIFKALKNILKTFKHKPQIINLNDKIEDNAIFVANHSGASGPLTYELFFPKYFIPWGAHEMCGNYKSRWKYLYHTFYRKKLKYNKLKSFFLATSFGIFSKNLYKATGLIGTYNDARLLTTFKHSMEVLDSNIALLIFPENSDDGYKEVLTEFRGGFVSMSKIYYKKRKKDLPIYNIYYSKKHKKMIIDKPIYINKLLNEGMSEAEIAESIKNAANTLYSDYILTENNKVA